MKDIEIYREKILNFKPILISEFFLDTGISTFLIYCRKNNLKYMKDLENFDFDTKLLQIKGIGESKQIKLKARYKMYIDMKMEIEKSRNVDDIPIKLLFEENTFNMFVKYCDKNKLRYIKDLEGFDFNVLLYERGFGEGKINKVKDRYSSLLGSISECNCVEHFIENKLESKIKLIEINDYYKDLNINFLKLYGISQQAINKLSVNYSNIGKLLDDIENNIYDINEIGKVNIDKLQNIALIDMKKDPVEIVNDIFYSIKRHKHYDILKLRAIDSLSLEQIGKIRKVSRERIRQLEKRINEDIKIYITSLSYVIFKNRYNKSRELETFIHNNEDLMVFDYYIKKKILDDVVYIEETDMFMVKADIDIQKELKLEIIKRDEMLKGSELDESELDYINYLIKSRYITRGKYIVKKNLVLDEIYKYIYKQFFNSNIKQGSDIKRFNEILNNEFGIVEGIDNDIISKVITEYSTFQYVNYKYSSLTYELEKYILEVDYPVKTKELMDLFNLEYEYEIHEALIGSEKIIRWDKNKYISPSLTNLSGSSKAAIKEIIIKKLTECNGVITHKELFNEVSKNNKNVLNVNNIRISYSLYYLVKYHLDNYFDFRDLNIHYGTSKAFINDDKYMNYTNDKYEAIIAKRKKSKLNDTKKVKVNKLKDKETKSNESIIDKSNKVKELLKGKDYISNKDINEACKSLGYTISETFKIYDRVINDFIEISKNKYKRK